LSERISNSRFDCFEKGPAVPTSAATCCSTISRSGSAVVGAVAQPAARPKTTSA
jgi:hypothetical protein